MAPKRSKANGTPRKNTHKTRSRVARRSPTVSPVLALFPAQIERQARERQGPSRGTRSQGRVLIPALGSGTPPPPPPPPRRRGGGRRTRDRPNPPPAPENHDPDPGAAEDLLTQFATPPPDEAEAAATLTTTIENAPRPGATNTTVTGTETVDVTAGENPDETTASEDPTASGGAGTQEGGDGTASNDKRALDDTNSPDEPPAKTPRTGDNGQGPQITLQDDPPADPCADLERGIERFRAELAARGGPDTLADPVQHGTGLLEETLHQALATVTEAISNLPGGVQFTVLHPDAIALSGDLSAVSPPLRPGNNILIPWTTSDQGRGHSSLYIAERTTLEGTMFQLRHYDSANGNYHRTPGARAQANDAIRAVLQAQGLFTGGDSGSLAPVQAQTANNTRQRNNWECGVHVVLYGWAHALGLQLTPTLVTDRYDDFLQRGVDIINLAMQGLMDSATIKAFMDCFKLIAPGQVVSPERSFGNTLRLETQADFLNLFGDELPTGGDQQQGAQTNGEQDVDPCAVAKAAMDLYAPQARAAALASGSLQLPARDKQQLEDATVFRAVAVVSEAISQLGRGVQFSVVTETAMQLARGDIPSTQVTSRPGNEALIPWVPGDRHISLYVLRREGASNVFSLAHFDSIAGPYHRPVANRTAAGTLIRDTLEATGWNQSGNNVIRQTVPVTGNATRQFDGWECGVHTVLSAWAYALGLRLAEQPQPQGQSYQDFIKNARHMINIALWGLMDSETIKAFLECYKFIQPGQSVPAERTFDRTVRLRTESDYHQHNRRVILDADLDLIRNTGGPTAARVPNLEDLLVIYDFAGEARPNLDTANAQEILDRARVLAEVWEIPLDSPTANASQTGSAENSATGQTSAAAQQGNGSGSASDSSSSAHDLSPPPGNDHNNDNDNDNDDDDDSDDGGAPGTGAAVGTTNQTTPQAGEDSTTAGDHTTRSTTEGTAPGQDSSSNPGDQQADRDDTPSTFVGSDDEDDDNDDSFFGPAPPTPAAPLAPSAALAAFIEAERRRREQTRADGENVQLQTATQEQDPAEEEAEASADAEPGMLEGLQPELQHMIAAHLQAGTPALFQHQQGRQRGLAATQRILQNRLPSMLVELRQEEEEQAAQAQAEAEAETEELESQRQTVEQNQGHAEVSAPILAPATAAAEERRLQNRLRLLQNAQRREEAEARASSASANQEAHVEERNDHGYAAIANAARVQYPHVPGISGDPQPALTSEQTATADNAIPTPGTNRSDGEALSTFMEIVEQETTRRTERATNLLNTVQNQESQEGIIGATRQEEIEDDTQQGDDNDLFGDGDVDLEEGPPSPPAAQPRTGGLSLPPTPARSSFFNNSAPQLPVSEAREAEEMEDSGAVVDYE